MVEYIIAGVGIAIAGHYFRKSQPQIKGYIGETKLARAVKRLKLSGNVHVMRDSLFHAEKGGTSQIDVMAVTRYGIIIMENKNFRCDVYGNITDHDWFCKYPRQQDSKDPFDYTKQKPKYTQIKTQYNPIKQNKSHISAVSAILRDKYPHIPYYPLVVFSDDACLHIQNSRNKVCNLSQVDKVISRIVGKEVLTDHQVDEITSILKKHQIKGRQARKNHVAVVNLGKAARDEYSYEDLKQIEDALLREAAGKPIWSSAGERLSPEQDTSYSCQGRPLKETIQIAHERTGAPEQPQPSHPGKSFSR